MVAFFFSNQNVKSITIYTPIYILYIVERRFNEVNKMVNEKRLFKVVWINKMVNGTVINPTTVKAKNIAGACKSVERRDGCIAVISATMITGPMMSDKDVETVEDYEEAAR